MGRGDDPNSEPTRDTTWVEVPVTVPRPAAARGAAKALLDCGLLNPGGLHSLLGFNRTMQGPAELVDL